RLKEEYPAVKPCQNRLAELRKRQKTGGRESPMDLGRYVHGRRFSWLEELQAEPWCHESAFGRGLDGLSAAEPHDASARTAAPPGRWTALRPAAPGCCAAAGTPGGFEARAGAEPAVLHTFRFFGIWSGVALAVAALQPSQLGRAHEAAEQGDVSALQAMSNEELQESFRGARPLHVAAAHNQLRAMDVLISRGAQLEELDLLGRTPLIHATVFRAAEAVVWLAHKGAKLACGAQSCGWGLHADQDGRTALHWAVRSSAPLTALLATVGAPLDVLDLEGCSPLGC
ncbi:unnamed protein product, partial [Effrenium voratum]